MADTTTTTDTIVLDPIDCADAAMIVRADIARFANDRQDDMTVARAHEVAEAHWHRFCPCYGFRAVPESTGPASDDAVAKIAATWQ